MRNRRPTLFTKYYSAVTFIVVMSFAIMGIILWLFLSNYWVDQKRTLLEENANTVAQMMEETVDQYATSGVAASNVLMAYSLNVISSSIDADIFVTDLNGDTALCSHKITESVINAGGYCPYHDTLVIPRSILEQCLVENNPEGVTLKGKLDGMFETDYLLVAKPIMSENTQVGIVFSIASVKGMDANSSAVMRIFIFAMMVALVVAVAVVYVLVYSIVKPLKQISIATRKIGNGDYAYRVEVKGDDELAELGDAFNTMAQSLATLESSRRSFVANVSHELKTPMTTIGGFIDGIIDGTIGPDKQEYYLQIVSNEVKRLSRLVVSMLNLSKIEAGQLQLQKEKLDVSQMIFDVLLSFEQSIEKKSVEILGLDQMQSIEILADYDMIYQVIYNLVDNAVKFTDQAGYISVAAQQNADKFVFRIKNKCEGIDSADLARIFERFYKVDRSRSLDVKGTGLGLYIVKTIIEMHGGQVTALSEEGENCEFVFWIPLL